MIKGNSDKFYGKGYIAYLDILGFSNEIKTRWNEKENNPLDTILKIKEKFLSYNKDEKKFYNEFNKWNPRNKNTTFFLRHQTISDSFIISLGLDNEFTILDKDGILKFFESITYLWRPIINMGYTIRGGIDYGDIYWDTNEIIGPAFINAYKTEHNDADYSRVILAENITKEIKKIYSYGFASVNQSLKKILRKDGNVFIINPSYLYYGDSDKEKLIKQLEIMSNKAPKENDKNKYIKLIRILNDEEYNLIDEDFV